ncbi:MAG TPA: hypothetical protein VFV75_04430 [Candidatus Polarisedimenticolaceae bacterium]|nr:hypothetical protein [Candidatus Polarisedimenticolaceae bacterium]
MWRPALWVLALLSGTAVHAEPYLAVRSGLSCSSCHLNRTGGGGRTAYGAGYGASTLPARWFEAGTLFDGALGERLRLGADGRAGYVGHMPADGPYLGEFRVFEANLYAAADLLPERLSFYVDERVAPGSAANREAFALLASHRAGMYAKAGRFFVPFGLRLLDDDAATRRASGFTFENPDTGLEVGADTGRWVAALSASNGSAEVGDSDNRKQYAATGTWIGSWARLGLSAASNDLPGLAHRTLGEGYAGFKAARLVLLVAYTRTLDSDDEGTRVRGEAGHLEADVEITRGLTVRAWAGAHDPDRSRGGDAVSQWGVGADVTPLPGLQVRGFWRDRDGGDDEVRVEAHVYF